MDHTIPTYEEIAKMCKERREREENELRNIKEKEKEEDNARADVITISDVATALKETFRQTALKAHSEHCIYVSLYEVLRCAEFIGKQRLGKEPFIPRHFYLGEVIRSIDIPGWYVNNIYYDYAVYVPKNNIGECCTLM